MPGLTEERISAVVSAHELDGPQGDRAARFASDVIQMIIEHRLSPSETACALELLADLRNDRAVTKP
jgi:hypothetical protein